MIKAHKVEVMALVEAGDMIPNNEPLKIKWRPNASDDEDETMGEDPHRGVEITRMFSVITVISLTLCFKLLAQNRTANQSSRSNKRCG